MQLAWRYDQEFKRQQSEHYDRFCLRLFVLGVNVRCDPRGWNAPCAAAGGGVQIIAFDGSHLRHLRGARQEPARAGFIGMEDDSNRRSDDEC